MDDDLIEELANAFAEQLFQLEGTERRSYRSVIYDDIVAVAVVINSYEPTYDMRYFYRQAGYPEPYPIHEMQG